jgi:DNA-directed RNA polymerase subunit RPC12/RpoP
MPGIFIMAIVTTVFSAGLIGGFIYWRTRKGEYLAVTAAILVNIPIYWIAFYLVRLPFHGWFATVMNAESGLFVFLTTFYAPLTEEPAKWVLLLLPWFRKKITDKNFVRIAMAIGLGFGLGEMWMIAERVFASPDFVNYPWYYYMGFLNERFMVCIAHGAFAAIMLKYMRKNIAVGMLAAMGLHYAANFPIYLSWVDPLNFGKTTWIVILSLYIYLFIIAMVLMLTRFAVGSFKFGRWVYGTDVCPDCGKEYDKPVFLAVNLMWKRYERCPHCGKWHMMRGYGKKVMKDGEEGAVEPDNVSGETKRRAV